ncbi:protein [Escherichia coli]|uniref:Protein n=1 Tax=Escherichia coli TaxID=562 RepID=A0A2X1N7L6_ECOLX|nr:protein [Escherichia coli]
MAKNRSRRLRKKMHIDEFQELGFSVAWRFPEGTSEEQIDKTVMILLTRLSNRTNWPLTAAVIWPGKV